jgi:hypothetical protein
MKKKAAIAGVAMVSDVTKKTRDRIVRQVEAEVRGGVRPTAQQLQDTTINLVRDGANIAIEAGTKVR